MYIEVSGVKIEIVKKNIKNMYLSVRHPGGEVRISAPFAMPKERILDFAREKLPWIERQRSKIKDRAPIPERKYESGEPFCLFGKYYTVRTEYVGRGQSLTLKDGVAILKIKEGSTEARRKAVVKEFYRDRLKEAIEEYLPKWEKITDLYCDSWQIKDMKTRWGTCNTRTRKIWLNLRLASAPPSCLEYVILHELAHLKVPGHGKPFVAIMDNYMPAWREIKKLLSKSLLD